MIGERTHEGREVRLETRDPDRYLAAAFHALWLCAWVLGEVFAIRTLIQDGIALLTGTAPDAGREPLALAPALIGSASLLIWLAFWTFFGVAAIGELLRLLWGEDRIAVAGGRLTVTRLRGPVRSARTFERDTIRRISLAPPNDRLLLEAGSRRVELSRLGSRAERSEAATALRHELSLLEPGTTAAPIPERWEIAITPEGKRALVPNPRRRRAQARTAAVMTMGAALVTFLIARGVSRDPGLIGPVVLAMIATCAFAGRAVWLARGRMEWHIGHGRLTLCRRFGRDVRDVFQARRLLLDWSPSEDGAVYALRALADIEEPAEPEEPAAAILASAWRVILRNNSRTVMRLMDDAVPLRDLAAWLARETDIALEDRIPPRAYL